MFLGEARTPEGLRLYAVGDIHGRDDLLAEMNDRIAGDLAERPAPDHRIIYCGDYVDRGPDSAKAIERLAVLKESDGRVVCLRGNHEDLALAFLDDPSTIGAHFLNDKTSIGRIWLDNGGDATLRSYGVTPSRWRIGRAWASSASSSRRSCRRATAPFSIASN